MRLYFSKSKSLLSKMIRWGTGSSTSHFAIGFKDDLLFQSNLLGSGLEYRPDFLRAQTVVHEIVVVVTPEIEDQIYKTVMPMFSGKSYDYGAFFYDVWRVALKKLFRIPMPTKNQWGRKDRYLCVGLAKALNTPGVPDSLRLLAGSIRDFDYMLPEDLYWFLRSSVDGKDVYEVQPTHVE